MAGIKAPLTDILSKLAAIQVLNLDHQTVDLYTRIWNNQVRGIENGETYSCPTPAAFVEFVTPVTFEQMGQGFLNADLGVKIHLVHVFYNEEGTFEQDLDIFDLRDKIISEMSAYCPTGCGPLNVINESQDYDHTNVYHYIIEFICNFVDSTASKAERTGMYEEITPDLDANVINGGVPSELLPEDDYFIINQNNTHK